MISDQKETGNIDAVDFVGVAFLGTLPCGR